MNSNSASSQSSHGHRKLTFVECASCDENNLECTYVEAAKRRGPPKGYVESLEQRCARLEMLVQKIQPGLDYAQIVGPPCDRDEFDNAAHQAALSALGIPPLPAIKDVSVTPTPFTDSLGASPWKAHEQDPNRPASPSSDTVAHAAISDAMKKLDLKEPPWRFHGKASIQHLVILQELRNASSVTSLMEGLEAAKRKEYWRVPEWELSLAHEGLRKLDPSIWPDPDLEVTLIDAYFDNCDRHFPLLNQILFRRQYQAGLYKTNTEFARVCLMVFANGARFTDDERVYWNRDDAISEEGKERLRTDVDGTLRYSAGWHFLRALVRMGRSIMQGPNLFDFQCTVLICTFLQGSAVPHLTWLVSGMGLRAAQELGIHVRSILQHADPIERALYSRAFWCLYHFDRLNCAAIGRSVAIQDSDFDADYPIAVDDEFWDTGDPSKDFVQPPSAGVPRVAAFIHTLKLDYLIGAALKSIYAINKTSADEDQRAIVVDLDSALNSWADSVPDGLRWDPTRIDQTLFEHSAGLYVHYYYCQILIHRPFIPTPKHPSTIGLPSLAICSAASRSICNIIDTVMRRGRQNGALPGRAMSIHFVLPAFTAAFMLLISVYSGKQQPAERDRAIADINKCISAMRDLEVTWRQAGALVDILLELSRDLRDENAPAPSLPQGQKRPWDPADDLFTVGTETLLEPNMLDPYGQIGDLTGTIGDQDDIWTQFFAGYA